MIELAGGGKSDFDGAKRREVLPFKPIGSYSSAADGMVGDFAQYGPYTLLHAVLFKVYLDLTRSGMVGKEAQVFARAVRRFGATPRGISRDDYKTPNFLDHDGDDLWIAREVFTGNYFSDPRVGYTKGEYFEVEYWAGTRADIDQFIALTNASRSEDERETMSLHLYNFSKAVREVRGKAAALGMIEAHDKGPFDARSRFL
ncbi:hypothetical protein [Sedimentitalea nanhaiensis]|uniref:Uncharacterized protein n=2 Tax=Sedimentitalea nanhaiensis TaxID=999627 RepID=A0A1I7CL25_9RHOB|nr:hypothetical protein [Sedimentitalea nanhaiensis]SFU00137.1 hypothetical protein SAMN05216236_11784 [Sedimentitalea nanhaiensis]